MKSIAFFWLILVVLPRVAGAVTDRFAGFDLWPAIGERNFYALSSSETLSPGRFSLDLSNSYARRSLDRLDLNGIFEREAIGYFLSHQLTGAVGITDHWQLGVTGTFFSQVRFESPLLDPGPGPENVREVGDLRLATRLAFWQPEEGRRWGLALEPYGTIPLGAEDHYLGENKVAAGGRLIGEVLPHRRMRLAVNVGAEWKPEQVLMSNIDFQHRFLSGIGLSGDLGQGVRLSLEGQANTAIRSFFRDRDVTPAEYLGTMQWNLGNGFTLGGGAGSCIVCGGKGARLRGLFTIGFRQVETPSPAPVVVTREKIEIHEPIHFEFGEAILRPESYPILKVVAEILEKNPHLLKIRVEGHTDDIGSKLYNLELSRKRAEAVRKHLIYRGIEPERLTTQGQGESRPIDTNRTAEGRSRNRRVVLTPLKTN